MKNLPVPEAHVQYGFQLRDVAHGKDGPVDVLRSDCVTICVHSGRHDTYRERERIEWPGSGQGAEIVSLEEEQQEDSDYLDQAIQFYDMFAIKTRRSKC